MSFGYGIGDIVVLAQLATRIYTGWKAACGDYAIIANDLATLQMLVTLTEAECRSPTSLFARDTEAMRGWETVSEGCHRILSELERILDKYKSLSRSKKRNWDRIRMANENLDSLSRELAKKTASMAAFLSVLGINSQGRVENEVFPELLRRIDDLAAQIRKGNGTIKSTTTWTTYDGDDKTLWREFRRDLVKTGFRGRDVKKYKTAIQTYLGQLQRDGKFDEEIPDQLNLWEEEPGDEVKEQAINNNTMEEVKCESVSAKAQEQTRREDNGRVKEEAGEEAEEEADQKVEGKDKTGVGKQVGGYVLISDSESEAEAEQGNTATSTQGSKTALINARTPFPFLPGEQISQIPRAPDTVSYLGSMFDQDREEVFTYRRHLLLPHRSLSPSGLVEEESSEEESSKEALFEEEDAEIPPPASPSPVKSVAFDPSVKDPKGGKVQRTREKEIKRDKTRVSVKDGRLVTLRIREGYNKLGYNVLDMTSGGDTPAIKF